jgi:hypothetical protein
VLDNCEHLIDACAKVADAIVRRCPRVHLVVTSREPLGISGEAIYRVPSLSLPEPDEVAPASADAVALFVERAKEQGASLLVDETTAPLVRASTWTRPKRCAASGHRVFDVADLLGSLVDKSLVVAEPTGETLRYRLPSPRSVGEVLAGEEQRFARLVIRGRKVLAQFGPDHPPNGADLAYLHETHGLPPELVADLLR